MEYANKDTPPPYEPASSPPPPSPSGSAREYRLHKPTLLSSKATITRPSDGAEFCLVADVHKSRPSHIRLHAGKDAKGPCLGSVEFPHTHNNFSIHTAGDNHSGPRLTSVRARVGHPHPSSYEFSLPPSNGDGQLKLAWTISRSSKEGTTYILRTETTNETIAKWWLVAGEKHQASLRWHVGPRSEENEMVVLLSFVGSFLRLKMKGKEFERDGTGLMRWNATWWMAVMGTAAIA